MALDTNIASYWKLDESSGNAVDSYGANTLTNNNTVTYSAGKINNGADFGNPNTNKSLSTSNTIGIDGGSMTMSGWFKISAQPPSNDNIRFLLQSNTNNKVSNMCFYRDSAGTKQLVFNRLRQNTANDQFTYDITLTIGTWYHIAYTYNGSTVTGYLNGVSIGTASSSGNGSSSAGYTNGFFIGSAFDSSNFLTGSADEVSIWQRALSADEVNKIYNANRGNQYAFTDNLSTCLNTNLMNCLVMPLTVLEEIL